MIKIIFFLIYSLSLLNNSLIYSAVKRNRKLKIGIIGAHDPNYDHIGKYAFLNKKKYAEKHGYDTIFYNENLAVGRPPHWCKVLAVKNNLKNYDWLFWSDSDALIMNPSIKLEDLIDENYDFIISRDCLDYLNTGHFLIKNSDWGNKFVQDWYDVDTIDYTADNGALIKLYNESAAVRKHIKVISARLMNSYLLCPKWYLNDGEYKDGDFVLHFVGVSYQDRAKFMKKYYEIFIKNFLAK